MTGFYMKATLAFNGLMHSVSTADACGQPKNKKKVQSHFDDFSKQRYSTDINRTSMKYLLLN